MREIEKVIKYLCIDYTLGLERVIAEAKTKTELLEGRAKLQENIRLRYEKRLSAIPENQRRMPTHFDIAKKYMDGYSESLGNLIKNFGEPDELDRLMNQGVNSGESDDIDVVGLNEKRYELRKNVTTLYSAEIKRAKQRDGKKILAGAAAVLLAGSISYGLTQLAEEKPEVVVGGNEPTVGDTMPQEEGKGLPSEEYYSKVIDGAPEIRSYTNDNGEFLRLDNIVDINTWAYNEVASELSAYQKANPNGKYDFDMSMISPETGCALMIAESSGAINSNTTNPDYQGPFSIGVSDEYIESVNTVAQALGGENCIDPNKVASDVQDPRVACKAYLYDMIENYRQLKYALSDAGLSDVEITQRLLIDSYLNGATGAVRKITRGEDYKRPYADKIMDYEEVFEDYADDLKAHPEIRNQDSTVYGRNAHQRLNKITEKYSNTPTRGGNSSAEEMD